MSGREIRRRLERDRVGVALIFGNSFFLPIDAYYAFAESDAGFLALLGINLLALFFCVPAFAKDFARP